MYVGAMNFPGRSVVKEVHRIAEDRFDFVDLTLEPPAAWLPNGRDLGRLISDLGMFAVGHTPWYLPIASPFPELREQACELFRTALDTFAEARVELVNVHPDLRVPLHSPDEIRKRNSESIARLAEDASERGITLMVENLDRGYDVMHGVLDDVPAVGFHLDVGHANLRLGQGERNRTRSLLEAHHARLRHVHLSDNRGGAEDLHLPLGAGTIDWKDAVRLLKRNGYDGTVTLEVFSREREHLRTSRRLWLEWWSEQR